MVRSFGRSGNSKRNGHQLGHQEHEMLVCEGRAENPFRFAVGATVTVHRMSFCSV
jgi:hypothetical protein